MPDYIIEDGRTVQASIDPDTRGRLGIMESFGF